MFVSSELDALLLASTLPGWHVIALTQQTPHWHPTLLQQQQQQAAPEDPRRCLVALEAELAVLRKEHDIGVKRATVAGADTAKQGSSMDSLQQGLSPGADPEGLTVSDLQDSRISGLQLLLGLPASNRNCFVVIAMQQTEGSVLLEEALSQLLDPVLCRQPHWPPGYSSPEDLLALAAETVQAAETAQAAEQSDPANTPAAGNTDLAKAILQAGDGLQELLLPDLLQGWSLLSVHVLLTPHYERLDPYGAVGSVVMDPGPWPIGGLERFVNYAFELMEYWDAVRADQLVLSTGWPALDHFYKVRG